MQGDRRTRRVLVVAGGETAPVNGLAAALPRCDIVVAADSGVHNAQALGLVIDVIVGDFDSASIAAVDAAVAAGAALERFPTAKDKTDLELALDHARDMGGDGIELVVVASVTGRLDHALANLLVLASSSYEHCRIDAYVDRWLITVLRDETRAIVVRPGATVTLLVVDARAARVTTRGLLYPLDDELVYRSSTRGVSNVAVDEEIEVRVDGGVLFVLREWAD